MASSMVLWSCAWLHTDGTTVRHLGVEPRPSLPEEVQLFTAPPDKPYDTIGLVVGYSWQGNIERARAHALEELKARATMAGADGVIRLRQAVLTDDKVVFAARGPEDAAPPTNIDNLLAPLFQTRGVLVRGEAIRFR